MKKLTTKKIVLLVVSLAVVLGLAVGSTMMFFTDETKPLVNTFLGAEVTNEITETFDGKTKSNVVVTNTGDVDARIRAAIIVNWTNETGKVILGQPVAGADYTMTLNSTDWVKGSDGYYYYKADVAPGNVTAALITECKQVTAAPSGYYLSVTVLADAIQATPEKARTEAGWKY